MTATATTTAAAAAAAALTVKEFCDRARIGKTFFYDEVKAGRIKIVKAGRKTLIPASEVGAWMERLSGAPQ